MRRYAWTCLLLLIPSSELGAQSTEDEIVAAAREACADLDGGVPVHSDRGRSAARDRRGSAQYLDGPIMAARGMGRPHDTPPRRARYAVRRARLSALFRGDRLER